MRNLSAVNRSTLDGRCCDIARPRCSRRSAGLRISLLDPFPPSSGYRSQTRVHVCRPRRASSRRCELAAGCRGFWGRSVGDSAGCFLGNPSSVLCDVGRSSPQLLPSLVPSLQKGWQPSFRRKRAAGSRATLAGILRAYIP